MDVDIEKVLVSNKIYFGEKNYKYFIGYLYNDNKFLSVSSFECKKQTKTASQILWTTRK